MVNLKFAQGAIGNIESHAQAAYGYDVRTEIVGSKGSIMVGNLNRIPATFLTANGGMQMLADHFLSSFADAYVAEMRDFVDSMLHDRSPDQWRGRTQGFGNCRCRRELSLVWTSSEGLSRRACSPVIGSGQILFGFL